MKTKTEARADTRRKWRRKERIVPFSSVASSASVEFTSQTSKCEPVTTEVQAETGRMSLLRRLSASVASVNQALLHSFTRCSLREFVISRVNLRRIVPYFDVKFSDVY